MTFSSVFAAKWQTFPAFGELYNLNSFDQLQSDLCPRKKHVIASEAKNPRVSSFQSSSKWMHEL